VAVVRSASFASLSDVRLLGAVVLAMACGVPGAKAAPPDQATPPERAPPQVEVWSGGQASGRIWSLYGGASFAPFGSVREDGFRVRGAVGYSDYGDGTISFADLLVGYHAQLGPLTLKAFAGVTGADFRPEDQLAAPQGAGLGGKGVVEAWWNVTDLVWTSADLYWGWTSDVVAWNSTHSVYSGRVRLGWRLWPELSAGLEGGAVGARLHDDPADTADPDAARLGGFVRYEWATGELSISGGLAIDEPGGDRQFGSFGTVSVLTRF
jgi:hypothetical protein